MIQHREVGLTSLFGILCVVVNYGHAQRTIPGDGTACRGHRSGRLARAGSQAGGYGADKCRANATPEGKCEFKKHPHFVASAVKKPGLYTLREGARAVEAVAKAGGLRSDADPSGVDLAAPLTDGEEIAAPLTGTRRTPHMGFESRHGPKARKKKLAPAAIEPIDLKLPMHLRLLQLRELVKKWRDV